MKATKFNPTIYKISINSSKKIIYVLRYDKYIDFRHTIIFNKTHSVITEGKSVISLADYLSKYLNHDDIIRIILGKYDRVGIVTKLKRSSYIDTLNKRIKAKRFKTDVCYESDKDICRIKNDIVINLWLSKLNGISLKLIIPIFILNIVFFIINLFNLTYNFK